MPAQPDAGHRLTIAVLTYRRPDDLASMLPVLVDELASARQAGLVGAGEVVVVDNDPDAGAGPGVAALELSDVRCVHEPQPGIAAARNRALDEADESRLLVFIDDDEVPDEGWLCRLLATRAEHGSVAVAGAVTSTFDGDLDPWIRAGGFFERRRLPTGTRIDVAATNNLLLDLDHVRRHGIRFDARYGLTGGEDTLFTKAVVRHGGTMSWCNEALVTDRVPRDRMTREWVLRRAVSAGNSGALTTIELAAGERTSARLRCLREAASRVLGGAARTVLGTLLRSPRHQARGSRTLARGIGMGAGALGLAYREYPRSGGRWILGVGRA